MSITTFLLCSVETTKQGNFSKVIRRHSAELCSGSTPGVFLQILKHPGILPILVAEKPRRAKIVCVSGPKTMRNKTRSQTLTFPFLVFGVCGPKSTFPFLQSWLKVPDSTNPRINTGLHWYRPSQACFKVAKHSVSCAKWVVTNSKRHLHTCLHCRCVPVCWQGGRSCLCSALH